MRICPRGEQNGNAVYTERAVLEMRRLRFEQNRSWGFLARAYGGTPAAARRAVLGMTWRLAGANDPPPESLRDTLLVGQDTLDMLARRYYVTPEVVTIWLKTLGLALTQPLR